MRIGRINSDIRVDPRDTNKAEGLIAGRTSAVKSNLVKVAAELSRNITDQNSM
jgi:hypothetical protein